MQAGHNLVELLRAQAKQRPASPAIISGDSIVSYREAVATVDRLALALLETGVRAGDNVGLSMGKSALHCLTLFALAQIGAVSVPLHSALPYERRLRIARRYGVTRVVSGQDRWKLEGLPFLNLVSAQRPPAGDGAPVHPAMPDTPFRVALSSGTSGDPKGMLFTHGIMAGRMRAAASEVTPMSRIVPMDINASVGCAMVMGMLSAGGAVVLPAQDGAAALLSAINLHAVTNLRISPMDAEQLLRVAVGHGVHCPTLVSLRFVGARPSQRLVGEVMRRLTPNVSVGYGTTETGAIARATPELLKAHPDTAGRTWPGAEVEIVDNDDNPVPIGTVGQIRIRKDFMVEGYHLDRERSLTQFRDGWFYPRDLGRLDEEGLLYVEGRADDVLNAGGLKINPNDIETVLLQHPAVQDAAAFLLEVEGSLPVLAAALVVGLGADEDGVLAHARSQLGPLAPKRLFFTGPLPRNPNGKLLREELSSRINRTLNAPAGGRG